MINRKIIALLVGLVLAGCVVHTGKPDAPATSPAGGDAVDVMRDVVYATAPGSPQQGDLYVPRVGGTRPGVIVVHGGSWAGRDRSDMDTTAQKIAQHGYVVLNIDYRLAPQTLYPGSVDDVRAAAAWLRAQAETLRVDPARIGGWGYSAGAHLVAQAANDFSDVSPFQAVVTCALPADFRRYPKSPIIGKYIGKRFDEAPQVWADASPIVHVSAASPPMFLYHGTWDRLVYVEDSIEMRDALVAAGVPAELYLVHGNGHISTWLLGFGAEAAAIDFLDRQLKR